MYGQLHVVKPCCMAVKQCIFNETDKCQLDKLQAKLVKCIVGIGPKYHTTALLDALCINKISLQIDINSMFLLRNIIHNHTGASKFYLSMLRINNKYDNNVKSNTNLCERVINCVIYIMWTYGNSYRMNNIQISVKVKLRMLQYLTMMGSLTAFVFY